MPQLQNIVVTDRATTPVNHTFVPRSRENGVGTVVESTGVPTGEPKLTVSMRQSGNRYRGKMNLTVPVVQNETINGITEPKVLRTAYSTVEFVFDSKSTLQERKDLVGMTMSALDPSKVLVNDTFTKLEFVF